MLSLCRFVLLCAGKILVFYAVFYAGLASFFAGLLAIFWQTLDNERPKWQLHESLIGTNPGLGFRPMPPEAHLGSTLIWYKSNRPDNMIYWHDTINKFLQGKSNETDRLTTQCLPFDQQFEIDIMIFFGAFLTKQNTLIPKMRRTLMTAALSIVQHATESIAHSRSNHWTIARPERQTKNMVSP